MCICCSDRIEVPSGRGGVVARAVFKVAVDGVLEIVVMGSGQSSQWWLSGG